MQIDLTQELSVEIEYEYSPEEKQELEHPHCPEEFYVTKVEIIKGSIVDLIYFLNKEEEFDQIVFKKWKEDTDEAILNYKINSLCSQFAK